MIMSPTLTFSFSLTSLTSVILYFGPTLLVPKTFSCFMFSFNPFMSYFDVVEIKYGEEVAQ